MPRSILEIANQERDKAGRKRFDNPPGSWEGKPALYQWKDRAAAWDLAEAERLSCDLAVARDEWRNTERETARLLLTKGQEGLKIPLVTAKLKDGAEIKGDPGAVRVAILALTEASNLARRALEMVSATTKLNVSALTDDELIRLFNLTEGNGTGGTAADATQRDGAAPAGNPPNRTEPPAG